MPTSPATTPQNPASWLPTPSLWGVDAIASIPPIYFKLPPHAIAKYWNDMSAAAPNTDFIIYNIPVLATALDLQNECCRIIYKLRSGHGNMYAMIKECLRKMGCPDCGSVRAPLAELIESDYAIADECVAMIHAAEAKYC